MELLNLIFLFGAMASILSFILTGPTVVLSISATISLCPILVLALVGGTVWKTLQKFE